MVLQVVNIPTDTVPLLLVKQVYFPVYGVNQGGLICGDTGGNKSFNVVQFVTLSDLYKSSMHQNPFGSLSGLRHCV